MNSALEKVFVDVTAWLAYVKKSDPYHEQAVMVIEKYFSQVVTSDYVLSCLSALSAHLEESEALNALIWQLSIDDTHKLLRVTEEEERQAWHVFCLYNDLKPSFAECTSLIILGQRNFQHWLSFNDWLPQTAEELHSKLELLVNS